MHKRWLARKYRLGLSKSDKDQFELKILAETLFKNKKKSYAKSLGPRFQTDRLGEDFRALKQAFVANMIPSGENIKVKLFFYQLQNFWIRLKITNLKLLHF